MIKRLKKLIPLPVRSLGRTALLFSLDAVDAVLGRRDDMVPPRRKSFVGYGDFQKIGSEFLGYFIRLGGLESNHRVLDVGCGLGRMAVPLTGFLKEGIYEGFDIVPEGIAWCKERISSKFRNFTFQHADVYNKAYNPEGNIKSSEFRFPYNDASFNFVFLTSIFTHMLPVDVDHYLSEIARVLSRGAVV